MVHGQNILVLLPKYSSQPTGPGYSAYVTTSLSDIAQMVTPRSVMPCSSDIRRKRGDSQQQHQRERQRQISQFSRAQRLEDKCSYCFSSAVRPKELAVAVGQATYLSLVQRGRLVEGHCCIVTAEHVASVRQVGCGH